MPHVCATVTGVTLLEIVVALVILVGLVGIVVPVLPGSVLIVLAVLVWSWQTGTQTAWVVLAVVVALVVVSNIVKYAVPGARLRTAGVPASTLWAGAALGVVGFFVVPVLGLFIGFPVGVYLAERRRLGSRDAWPATVHALKAVGLSILIELAGASLAAGTWVAGVVLT